MSAGSRVSRLWRDAKGGAGMKRLLQFFSRDDQDNEPIEYGVIAAGLTLALVVVLAQVGGALTTTF
jgi:Flp pilus assembly pilin Flp